MALHFLRDLLLQRHARIEHHPQQPNDAQVPVEVGMHALDGVGQIRQALQRVVFALHRNDHAVGAGERIEREQGKRGRTIDEHEIIGGRGGGERIAQAEFTPRQVDELHFGAGQFPIVSTDGKCPQNTGLRCPPDKAGASLCCVKKQGKRHAQPRGLAHDTRNARKGVLSP